MFMSGTKAGAFVADVKEMSINELHHRLGHVSHERARLLVKKGLVEGVTLEADSEVVVCESCEWAKGERKAVYKVRESERCTAIGDEIHSDLWGPAPVESINHKRYYVSFTDDYSRYTNVYFLHTKDETFDAYRAYEAWLLNQYETKVKSLRTDRGGEYLSDEFSAHLKKAGTIQRLTIHDTPEHNGVAERLNRTLLEKVRAMLHETDLPKFLWAEAMAHAVYLKNRTWTRTIGDTTPFELLNGQRPNIANLQPWGCKVRVHDATGSKLDGRSSVGRWMGFDAETRDGHRIYWPERRTVSVERSVKFNFEPEEVVVGVLPLEGERKPVERSTIDAERDVDNQGPNQTSIDVENPVEDPVPEAKPAEGRGQRIRKETEYVRLLKEGSGVTGSRGGGVLPRGMRPGTSSVGGDSDGIDHATAVNCEEVTMLWRRLLRVRKIFSQCTKKLISVRTGLSGRKPFRRS